MKPYEGCRINKWLNVDTGRWHMRIVFPDGTKRGTLYARYLMECHLGRFLTLEEEVHHKNGNPLDDRIDNLEVLTTYEHRMKHHPRVLPKAFECPVCGKIFLLTSRQITMHRYHRSVGAALSGPFCSQSCINKNRKR